MQWVDSADLVQNKEIRKNTSAIRAGEFVRPNARHGGGIST